MCLNGISIKELCIRERDLLDRQKRELLEEVSNLLSAVGDHTHRAPYLASESITQSDELVSEMLSISQKLLVLIEDSDRIIQCLNRRSKTQ